MVLFPSYFSFPLMGAIAGVSYGISEKELPPTATYFRKAFENAKIVAYGLLGAGTGFILSCGC
jgi:hypothetical protein